MKNDVNGFDLQGYLSDGIERVVKEALRATLKDPKESAFMLRFAAATRAASKKRKKLEEAGEHIPSFLIASITSECNLHCAGCYSRCNHATVDAVPVCQLTGEEWQRLFTEADELGVSFILLAGGEPMLRRDVIEAAAKISQQRVMALCIGLNLQGFYSEDLLNKAGKPLTMVPEQMVYRQLIYNHSDENLDAWNATLREFGYKEIPR